MNLIEKIKLLPDACRGLLFSDPYRNGEYRFLNKTMRDGMIVFDVGANTGEYAEYLSALKNKLIIHCFEPSKNTYTKLQERLTSDKSKNSFYLNNFGLSNIEEESDLYIYTQLGGTNSIYFHEQLANNSELIIKEKIRLRKLDDYIIENKIERIDFLKIDVEGHEYKVISGGIESIKNGIIKRLQFEYGGYWLKSGSKLLEVLKFLEPYNYKFYRLTPWGKIRIKNFLPNLENYKHSNYLAIKNSKHK